MERRGGCPLLREMRMAAVSQPVSQPAVSQPVVGEQLAEKGRRWTMQINWCTVDCLRFRCWVGEECGS